MPRGAPGRPTGEPPGVRMSAGVLGAGTAPPPPDGAPPCGPGFASHGRTIPPTPATPTTAPSVSAAPVTPTAASPEGEIPRTPTAADAAGSAAAPPIVASIRIPVAPISLLSMCEVGVFDEEGQVCTLTAPAARSLASSRTRNDDIARAAPGGGEADERGGRIGRGAARGAVGRGVVPGKITKPSYLLTRQPVRSRTVGVRR